ncbi:Serum paraoxonase/arylesterase 2 [Mactra antiquata]
MFSSFFVTVSLFASGIYYVIQYRAWLDLDKENVLNVVPGNCKAVLEDGGSEDLTHVGDGIILMSTGFAFDGSKGQIKAVDLNNGDKVMTLNISNAPTKAGFLAAPHGITTWRDTDTDELFLYVLCHPASGDSVEVFKVEKSLTLTYIKSITDSNFDFMNDLVAVGKDKFYITRFSRYRDFYKYNMEIFSGRRYGGILYYDGKRAREVASGYYLPNGINISPDKRVVYVAEWGTKTLKGFKRDRSNNLMEIWSKYTGTGIDNIEVDEDGDLWIGSHPITYKVIDPTLSLLPPGQVIRVKMDNNAVSDIEIIYQDDGTNCAGSTAATYVAGKMIVGTVREQTVVCEVKYLSK